jgi:Zn-dependent M28 family amino/carboxypeptidase
MVMEAIARIGALPVPPRRTVRAVLFTNEENGLRGGTSYAERHDHERHVAALEADTGAGTPLGFRVGGADEDAALDPGLAALMAPLATLLSPWNASSMTAGGGGADIGPTIAKGGVLGLGLSQDMSTYWPIHHTEADTVDKVEPEKLAAGTAVVTVATWWLAETPELPTP